MPTTQPGTQPARFSPDRPQHLFINRAPGNKWNQNRPDSINDELFTTVTDGIGVRGDRTGARQLGVSLILSYLNGPRERLTTSLNRILERCERLEIPLLLVLDGMNWWDFRPDLWNWWDKSKPGYDPKNVENVEWTDPGPEHAVKVCWRNWGRQIRVKPAPNLASPRYLAATREELEYFARLVKEWSDRLPAHKRHLFPGIKIGWEASIGINAYHHPNGNHYFEQFPNDESHDPKGGHDMSKDFAAGFMPLGYAALASEGKPAKRVTLEDHERIVSNYLRFIASVCRGVGFTSDQLFLHAGGQYAPWELHYSHRTAVNPDGTPGYSFYNTLPQTAGDLGAVLDEARKAEWCAAEWLTNARTADGWATALEQTLGFRRCRSLTVYNWEGIETLPHAIEGLRQTLKNAPEG